MRHLKKFIERIPRYQLAKALVDFFNVIHPEFQCYYEKDVDGININSTKGRLALIQKSRKVYTSEFGGQTKEIPVNLFHNLWEYNNTIKEFLLKFFHSEVIAFQIDPDEIAYYVKELTKQNYEDFVMRQQVKKYNI